MHFINWRKIWQTSHRLHRVQIFSYFIFATLRFSLTFTHCCSFSEFYICFCVLLRLWPVNEPTDYFMIFFFLNGIWWHKISYLLCIHVCLCVFSFSRWFGVFHLSRTFWVWPFFVLAHYFWPVRGNSFWSSIPAENLIYSWSLNCHHSYRLLTRLYFGHFLLWIPDHYVPASTGQLHLIILHWSSSTCPAYSASLPLSFSENGIIFYPVA